jgi:hypothetical protein
MEESFVILDNFLEAHGEYHGIDVVDGNITDFVSFRPEPVSTNIQGKTISEVKKTAKNAVLGAAEVSLDLVGYLVGWFESRKNN